MGAGFIRVCLTQKWLDELHVLRLPGQTFTSSCERKVTILGVPVCCIAIGQFSSPRNCVSETCSGCSF